ncbi:MAG: hypothetical protein LR015_12285 [Verrucomicrobia bacterium]|nr:hypothetical protein [Verrucomicrobiota bacterium]
MSKAELLRSFGEDGDSLDAELAEVRKRGYERLRRSDGEESLAVPVGSPAIAGLALSGRMAEEQIQVRLEELRDVAARLAAP